MREANKIRTEIMSRMSVYGRNEQPLRHTLADHGRSRQKLWKYRYRISSYSIIGIKLTIEFDQAKFLY